MFDIVVGISSFGEETCKDSRPGVFTNIAYVSAWIEQTIENVEAGRPAQVKVGNHTDAKESTCRLHCKRIVTDVKFAKLQTRTPN